MTSLLELFIEVEDLLKLRLHFLARFLKLKNGQVLVLECHSSIQLVGSISINLEIAKKKSNIEQHVTEFLRLKRH